MQIYVKQKNIEFRYYNRKNIDKIVFLYNKTSIINEKVYNNNKFVFVEKERKEINKILQNRCEYNSIYYERVKKQLS